MIVHKLKLTRNTNMWLTIIELVISAIAGGALTGIFTIHETRKSMKIDNKTKEDERWHSFADELQEQITQLNERMDKKDSRIMELEDRNASLRQQLDEKNTSLAKATLLRCTKLNCERRRPPLGYSELSPEEIMEETKIEE